MFKLTKSKFRALSTLSSNFSEVFLASLVLPIFTGGSEVTRWPIVLFGIIFTILLGGISLIVAEKGKL